MEHDDLNDDELLQELQNRKIGYFPPSHNGNIRPYPESRRDKFMPNYPIREVDYNLNALSYYHYLGRWNDDITTIFDLIDRLLKRDLTVESTPTIEFIKEGSWRRHGDCLTYDDIINLKANVVLSKKTREMTLEYFQEKITLVNSLSIETDGLYSPDYLPYLNLLMKEAERVNTEINNIKKEIENIKNQNTTIVNAIQQIIDNLYSTGAITNNTFNFEFLPNRNVVTGNMTFFSTDRDGSHFLKGAKDNTNYDISAGVD